MPLMLRREQNRLFIASSVLLTFGSLFYLLYLNTPELTEEEKPNFKYPRNLEDAKRLGLLLSSYKSEHYLTVLCGVTLTYIFLQSFAIPGSIFLTIMSGYLFPFPVALLLVCSCSSMGAGICYMLSSLLGKQLVMDQFSERVLKWQSEIEKHSDNLLHYVVFLRVTPLLPNWFINIASPVLGVPFSAFFWGTFVGVAPPSFLFLQAGTTLEQLTHEDVKWSYHSLLLIVIFAALSLLPVLYNRRQKNRKDF